MSTFHPILHLNTEALSTPTGAEDMAASALTPGESGRTINSSFVADESLVSTPGYLEFLDACRGVFNLANRIQATGEINCVPEQNAVVPNGPVVRYLHEMHTPSVGMRLIPVSGSDESTSLLNPGPLPTDGSAPIDRQIFFAPICIRGIETLSNSSLSDVPLAGHLAPIAGGAESRFTPTIPLGKHLLGLGDIDRYDRAFKFTGDTPVVRLVALMPDTVDRRFICECLPNILLGGWQMGLVFVGAADLIGEKAWVKQKARPDFTGGFDLHRPSEDNKTSRFRPIFLDQDNYFARATAPNQNGHIIQAMAPVKPAPAILPKFIVPQVNDFGFTRDPVARGGCRYVSQVDLVAGGLTGKSGAYLGKLLPDPEHSPIVFDIQVLALSAKQALELNPRDLVQLIRENY